MIEIPVKIPGRNMQTMCICTVDVVRKRSYLYSTCMASDVALITNVITYMPVTAL